MVERSWRVEYHQYLVVDPEASIDWAEADGSNDGLLAPTEGGVRVSTGVQSGVVDVDVELVADVALRPAPAGAVTSECSLHSPSGRVSLSTTLGDEAWLLVEDQQTAWWRLRVSAWGRDSGPERHRLELAPDTQPRQRLFPRVLDDVAYEMSGRPRPRRAGATAGAELSHKPLINVAMTWAGLEVPEGVRYEEYALRQPRHSSDATYACEVNWLGYGWQPGAWPPTACPSSTFSLLIAGCRADRCAGRPCGGHYVCSRHVALAEELTSSVAEPWDGFAQRR